LTSALDGGWLKARIVESEETAANRQQLSKHHSVAMSACVTIDEQLETMFLDGLTLGSLMRTNGASVVEKTSE
jgi:hypothetical protein